MESQEVKSNVRTVIANVIGCDLEDVTDSATLEDLGAYDLDVVEILMECERDFHISIPDEDFEKVKNVGQFIDMVISKVVI